MARTTALVPVVELELGDGRRRFRWLTATIGVLTVAIGGVGYSTAPRPLTLALLGLILCCIAALVRPAAGLYMILFLALIGDSVTAPWWPFTKNFSSRESILFINDSLTFTPMEVLIAVTLVSVFAQRATKRISLHRGRVTVPALVLAVFIVFGFVKGSLAGGDRVVAILEVRPLVYIVVLYLLATNVFRKRSQYRVAFGLMVTAVFIQSIVTLIHYFQMPRVERSDLESLAEHHATVTMNVLFLLALSLALMKGSRWKPRVMIPLLVPVVVAYMLSQRRAGMIALFAGIAVLFGVLYMRRRAAFWVFAPIVVLVGGAFVVATWNATGSLGLASSAVKSVLFPNDLSTNDQSSDLYRMIEAYNVWFTIHASPITGFGFGQPFIPVVPLPNITFFENWLYFPHHALLWVWIKMGFFGFVAFMFMFGRGIQRGARAAVRAANGDDAAILTASVGYMVMFLVFSYVDIIWDSRPAVMLAMCMAICADYEELPDWRQSRLQARFGSSPVAPRPTDEESWERRPGAPEMSAL